MKAKKPPVRRKLVRQKVGAVDRRRRKRGLTPAIKTAIDSIVHDRSTRAQACKKAGISERALYLALQKAEVAVHWNAQIEVLRSAERPSNLFALMAVRDGEGHKNPMARVAAAKALEQLAEPVPGRPGGAAQVLPGLVVVIRAGLGVQPPAPRPPIDITPPRPIVEHRPAEPIFAPNGSKAR